MLWLSGSADELVALASSPQAGTVDVVVVGSGYGGAVAALRFAQAGLKVLVLERGAELLAGEFPNDFSEAGRHVRAEVAGAKGISAMGYEGALFDFRIGLNAGALVGNGLGGGSLINAAVALQPDPRVFQQEDWPAALRQEDLSPWFGRARDMLEVRPDHGGDAASFRVADTAKYRRMRELAHEARGCVAALPQEHAVEVRFAPAPLAIEFGSSPRQDLGPRGSCVGCGDCVTGCNENAKLSLTKTYLPAACKAGARFYTGVSVLRVERGDEAEEHSWVVEFTRTGDRKLRQDIARAGSPAEAGWLFRLRAHHVVLAAGTFGSTEILLRSRAAGLSLSNTALGARVSGNGDDASFAYDLPAPAHAVGHGSSPVREPAVGPTISAVLHFDDPRDVTRSTVVEDGAAPGFLGPVHAELLATLGTFAQIGSWRRDEQDGGDAAAVHRDALQRSLPLLGVGHDQAGGMIVFDAKSDRVGWGWRHEKADVRPLHDERMQPPVRALGGMHIPNPLARLLPDDVRGMLSGPPTSSAIFTVHPLGGCRMADNPIEGVVNHWGAVWRNDGSLHEGLYVMDGSVMPGSLGANPLLTITALAERACDRILRDIASLRAPAPRELPAYPKTPQPLQLDPEVGTGATLREVLRGQLRFHDGQGPASAALFVEMEVAHWRRFLQDPRHRARVPAAADPQAYGASRLVLDRGEGDVQTLRVASGEVQLFRRLQDGWLRHSERALRIAATYAVARWIPDMRKRSSRFSGAWLVTALKALSHATEVRVFDYTLALEDAQGARYQLRATKRIEPAASWRALWTSLRVRGHWRAPARRSWWEQLTELDVELRRDGRRVASGRFTMDIEDTCRNLLPQLGPRGDMLNASMDLAGYPMLLVRGLMKTRFLDFRAPDYRADLPATDPALLTKPHNFFELAQPENAYPPITTAQGPIAPEPPVCLRVRWSHREAASETVRIGLVRYRQPHIRTVTDDKQGMVRARSIVLANGFAQSARTFVAPELGAGCLAAMLYDQGWDVWLLEYRVSPLLDASARFSTMDDIAAFDYPAAVEHVARTVAREAGTDPDRTQVHAYSHCVGSAALAMSLLGGHLALPARAQGEAGDARPSRLAGVVFGQMLPHVVGSHTAQQRLQLACLIANVLGRDYLAFTAGAAQPDLLHATLDRLFAGFPTAQGEQCPHEHDLRIHQPDTTTCKRMSGLLSRLFAHRQLLDETHAKLDWYWGRANLGVFLHGAKCVEAERLVNAEGQNAYLTDANLREHLQMPVLLVHGAENVLFDPESLRVSHEHLARVLGPTVERFLVPDHAHFDCTIGKNAPREIFPHLLDFLERAFTRPAAACAPRAERRALMPRTGPIAGWVRRGEGGARLVRVWMELDSTTQDAPVAGITDLQYEQQGEPRRVVQTWPVARQQLQAGNASDLAACSGRGRTADVAYCVADVVVPEGVTSVRVRMVGLHESGGGEAAAQPAALDTQEVDRLLDALRADLERRTTTARKAEPATLSRRSREMCVLDQCALTLGPQQLGVDGRPGLRFIAAGCRHPGVTGLERSRADASLLGIASADASDAAFMLMLGDQVYVDARAGLFDAASPIERLLPRYRDAFGSPGFRGVARQLPLYMVADDHELEDGWSQEHRSAGPVRVAVADNATHLFRSFQRSHGPDGGPGGEGHDYAFEQGGHAFLVLDTRFGRARLPQPRLLSPGSWQMLERWLDAQAGRPGPKFIASGAVFAPGLDAGRAGVVPAGVDNWQEFAQERALLLEMIRARGVRNVVFLSCDYHCSAVAEIAFDGEAPTAWAVVSPPLHAPMRFANTASQELLARESVALAAGAQADIALRACWEGQGWMRCEVQPVESGWELRIGYRLSDLHTGAPRRADHTIVMPR